MPIFAAAALAGGIGFTVDHARTTQLLTEAKSEARASATAFAQAASAWLRSGATDYLTDVIDLMLVGSVAYIEVNGSDGAAIIDRRREDWADVALAGRTPVAGTSVLVWRRGRGPLVADVVVPVDLSAREPLSRRGLVRVGYELNALPSRVGMLRIAICGGSAGGWLFFSLGLLGAVFRPWRVRREGEALLDPGHVESAPPLCIDEAIRQATLCRRPIELRPKPYQLLALLISRGGQAVSEAEILVALWPDSKLADSGDVRQCIYLLRRSLDAALPKAGRCIANVKSYGYRFDETRLRALCAADSQGSLEGGEHE